MPGGRPFGTFRFRTVEELDEAIDRYFEDCDNKGKPYTMAGLALALNVSPVTLQNYGKEDYAEGKYFGSISRARTKVLAYAESRIFDKEGSTGAKFMLTNNSERMGGLRYAERVENAITPMPITFVDDLGS